MEARTHGAMRSVLGHWVSLAKHVYHACARRLGSSQQRLTAFSIRTVGPSDMKAICAALQEPGSWPTAVDLRRQSAGDSTISVAWLGKEPIAIGFIQWLSPRNEELKARWPQTPEIYRLHVRDEYRSQGLGSLLVQYKERLAASHGYRQVGLGVHLANDRAHELYLRLGYREDAQPFYDEYVKTDIGGRPVEVHEPSIFLVKDLTGERGPRRRLRPRTSLWPRRKPAAGKSSDPAQGTEQRTG
jgi:ribosomal protein S18 acetylase RimI-like enzyme